MCQKRFLRPRPSTSLPPPFTMHRSLRSPFRKISPRDVIFILFGAASLHLCSLFLPHVPGSSSVNFNTYLVPQEPPAPTVQDSWHPPQQLSPIPHLPTPNL